MVKSEPVQNEQVSPAKYTARDFSSSGVPSLPMGESSFQISTKGFRASEAVMSSVPIYPGLMELTRMFFFASSIAIDLVSMMTPALDAL